MKTEGRGRAGHSMGHASHPEQRGVPMVTTVAVDLGGTNIRAGLVRENGTIIDERVSGTPDCREGPAPLTDHLLCLLHRLFGENPGIKPSGIGISVAGPIDFMNGVLTNPPNIPCKNIPLKRILSEAFSTPVHMLNDCHAGIIGETAFGVLKDIQDAVYLTISTGIGAGVASGGNLVLGRAGNTAEVGHFGVDTSYNFPCPCGHTGHWEGYASGRNMPHFFTYWCRVHGHQIPDGPTDARELFERARRGDLLVESFLDDLSRINARGLSDIIVAYDPAVIVLDGSVIRYNHDLLLRPMLEYADRYLPLPDVKITALEGRAPLLGAGVIGSGLDNSPLGISLPGKPIGEDILLSL